MENEWTKEIERLKWENLNLKAHLRQAIFAIEELRENLKSIRVDGKDWEAKWGTFLLDFRESAK